MSEKAPLRAFHGDAAVKEKYLGRVREHRAQDQIVQNYGYWKDGKGCAVGCTIHSGAHNRYEVELGIPTALAHLEDALFEAIPVEAAREWPLKFLEAIPVGADLSMVLPHFLYWLLSDESEGVIRFAPEGKFPRVRAAIQNIAALLARKIAGETVDRQLWINGRTEARNAYDGGAAAYAAAYAATATNAAAAYAAAAAYDAAAYAATNGAAAYDATNAATAAATAAAAAAFRSSKWQEARASARVKQSEKLLEILRAAPVVTEAVTA